MRHGTLATRFAAQQRDKRTEDWTRMCQNFVRTSLDVPAYYGSARKAWDARVRPHGGTPPPAVPVYFRTRSKWWHVALSAGGGYVWSTDALRTGHVDKISIKALAAKWNAPYLGWDEYCNRQRILFRPLISAAEVTRCLEGSRAHPHGILLKRELAAAVGRGNMDLASAGLGSGTRSQVRLYQKKVGGTVDGTLNSFQLGMLANRRDVFTARS